jgi:hypothetical protein
MKDFLVTYRLFPSMGMSLFPDLEEKGYFYFLTPYPFGGAKIFRLKFRDLRKLTDT